MRRKFCAIAAMAAVLFCCGAPPELEAQETASSTNGKADRLYTLDCGLTEFKDASIFSDTGEYDGRSVALPTPCYLIRHGTDWLLWDTGNGDKLATLPNGIMKLGGRFTMKRTLAGQLSQIGLKPDDIRYVAMSHLHQDHAGNVGLFPRSTFLVAKEELTWARSTPTPFGVDPEALSILAKAHVEASDEDRDVFGDGSVRILKAPGHTPGSRMLLVRLTRSGPVLISGDLFHTQENHQKGLVPSPNFSRADTLASGQRMDRLAMNTHARIVIHHAPEDFRSMPAFPSFLD